MDIRELQKKLAQLEEEEKNLLNEVKEAKNEEDLNKASDQLIEVEKDIESVSKSLEIAEKAEKKLEELAAKGAGRALDGLESDSEDKELDKLEKAFDNNALAKYIATRGESKLDGALKEANEEARKETVGNNINFEYKENSFVIPGSMIKKEYIKQEAQKATVDQANSAIQPTVVGQYVDGIRQNAIYSRVIPSGNILQGLTADFKIPAVGAHNLVWEGENDAAADIGAQYTKDTLSPIRLSGYVPISRKVLLQNGDEALRVIMTDLGRSEANMIDAALFSTANVSGAIPAIAATSGVLTFTEAASYAAPSATVRGSLYDDILAGVQTLANGDVQATAIVHNTKVMSDLIQSPQVLSVSGAVQSMSANGVYVVNINGILVYLTTSTTSSGTTSADFVGGDFNFQFLGFFGGVEIQVDPYSGSKNYADHIVYHRHMDSSAIRGAGFVKGTSLLS